MKIREKVVYLEEADAVVEQARLIGSFGIDSVLLSTTLTDRAAEAIRVLREEFRIRPKIFFPMTRNRALTEDHLAEVQATHANGIVLKMGHWGLQDTHMDPGGFQYDPASAVQDLSDWLEVNGDRIDVPIYLHPVRHLMFHPQTFYQDLLEALAAFGLPLSIDLAAVEADMRNWGSEHAAQIRERLQDKRFSGGLFWTSAVRESEGAIIPCACQPVDPAVWNLWSELSQTPASLLVMTDRLSSDEQIRKDLTIINTVKDVM